MTVYYFEIERVTRGWLRIDAPTLEEAKADILENGFNASGIVGSEEHTEVTIIDGGEETD
jgi:hypothetical protein